MQLRRTPRAGARGQGARARRRHIKTMIQSASSLVEGRLQSHRPVQLVERDHRLVDERAVDVGVMHPDDALHPLAQVKSMK